MAFKEYKRASHESYKYYEIPAHYLNKLTLEQMDSLGDLNRDTNLDYTFRQVQFQKKFEVALTYEERTEGTQRVHFCCQAKRDFGCPDGGNQKRYQER